MVGTSMRIKSNLKSRSRPRQGPVLTGPQVTETRDIRVWDGLIGRARLRLRKYHRRVQQLEALIRVFQQERAAGMPTPFDVAVMARAYYRQVISQDLSCTKYRNGVDSSHGQEHIANPERAAEGHDQ
jgi:hypothetical protein